MKIKVKIWLDYNTIGLFFNHDLFLTEIAAADFNTINNFFVHEVVINPVMGSIVDAYSEKINFLFKLFVYEDRLSLYNRNDTPYIIKGSKGFESAPGREFEIAEIPDAPPIENIPITGYFTPELHYTDGTIKLGVMDE